MSHLASPFPELPFPGCASTDAPAPDVSLPDVPFPGAASSDAPAPGVSLPDVPFPGAASSDAPALGVSLPDVPFSYFPVAEPGPGQRWSTWDDIGVLAGPEPRPDWVITADAAVDTELGILKTGKEADVFLLERATQDQAVVLAAKRYRGHTERAFHRDESYRAGRRTRNSRDTRAAAKGSRWGRTVQADQWARAEFGFLSELWSAGLPVPYPVQLDGAELLMEFIALADGSGAPRLAQLRPSPDRLAGYWEQLTDALRVLTSMRLAHGDLSAFNLLAADERLVIIDLPQAVDIIANPQGMEFLARDCRNVASWFRTRGLDVDGEALLGELASYAW